METCGSDRYVHYLNCGDAFMGIYIYQNYICKIGAINYANYTPIKLLKITTRDSILGFLS